MVAVRVKREDHYCSHGYRALSLSHRNRPDEKSKGILALRAAREKLRHLMGLKTTLVSVLSEEDRGGGAGLRGMQHKECKLHHAEPVIPIMVRVVVVPRWYTQFP